MKIPLIKTQMHDNSMLEFLYICFLSPLEVNFMWAAHQVHHSSEYYNLTTALRQSVLQIYTSWVRCQELCFQKPVNVYSFEFMGANFCGLIVGFLLIHGTIILWMGRFSVSVKNTSLSKFFVNVKDVTMFGEGYPEMP